MGSISHRYLREYIDIINEPIFKSINNFDSNFDINIEFIDELYENKLHDECILLVNLVIRNRLSFNYTFIFKTLALIDKINFLISEKEIESLISIIKIENFDEFFNIMVVLIASKCEKVANRQFRKYVAENKVLKDDLIKFIVVCKWFDIFEKEIDISNDKSIINNLIYNLNYICDYIQKIELYDPKINTKNLLIEILIYLNNRFDLIENEEIKKEISDKIGNFTFDFNNITKLSDELILEKFKLFPKVISGCFQLSEFMMSNEDIILKRNNLLHVSRIILKNFDDLTDTFHKLISQGKNILLVQLFRFAYHGEVNKELFHNCVTISRKFLELKSKRETINFEEIEKNDKLNSFYYEPKNK